MDFLLLLLPLIICLAAQINVSSTYAKYHRVKNARSLTGAEVARRILDSNGLTYVNVEPVQGHLSNHYDPRANVVRLSQDVYDQTSVAALGVAAHECGHALQHAESYAPLTLRTSLAPVTGFCSSAWYLLFVLGLFFSGSFLGRGMVTLGILLFTVVTVFQLITLPVEFNASHRAMHILETQGYLEGSEVTGAGKVLRAAALTYVAALLHSVLQLLRLIKISRD